MSDAGTQRGAGPGGRWSPGPAREDLLRAALLRGAPAIDAWERWKAGGGPAREDPPSRRLLPFLHAKLRDAGHPDAAALQSLHLHTWAQGEVLRGLSRPVLQAFADRKIDFVVLKGVALVELAYGGDGGARPFGDVDVLVPPEQVDDALAALAELGWADVWLDPPRVAHLRRVVHSCGFANGSGGALDLHWHLLLGCCWPGADDPFLSAAVPFELGGLRARTLCASDHLLQACAHGVLSGTYGDEVLLQWVVDAAALLRAPSLEVDWDRVVGLTRELRLVDAVGASLHALRALDLPVPGRVLEALDAAPRSAAERVEAWTGSFGEPRPRRLLNFTAQYLRLRRSPRFASPRGALRFMQDYWGVDRPGRVPSTLLRKVGRNAAQLARLAWSRRATQSGTERGSGPRSSQ